MHVSLMITGYSALDEQKRLRMPVSHNRPIFLSDPIFLHNFLQHEVSQEYKHYIIAKLATREL